MANASGDQYTEIAVQSCTIKEARQVGDAATEARNKARTFSEDRDAVSVLFLTMVPYRDKICRSGTARSMLPLIGEDRRVE